ncbi:adipocyte plasma membrane-associated protein-like [Diadema setosum]|uniref:adipocyte plasma membrane-associated protein-like n=1 Tax=Diadema setosum TaxID=31175 RepID=UPI003B3B5B89
MAPPDDDAEEGGSLPEARPFRDGLSPNEKLQTGTKLFDGQLSGPESLLYHEGYVYTATYDSRIVRLDLQHLTLEQIVFLGEGECGTREAESRCGRPLGLRLAPDGNLLVMDAYKGIIQVNLTTGNSELIMSSKLSFGGFPVRYGNDLTIAEDGTIYFTDCTQRWERKTYQYSIMEAQGTGRLLWFNPLTKLRGVALYNLFYPNGVQLSHDGRSLLVCETRLFRVIRYHLTGPQEGETEVFVDNLPGVPDNIRPSRRGGYWIGLAFVGGRLGPLPVFDLLAPRPHLRKIMAKFVDPARLIPYIPRYGLAIEVSAEGDIIQSLHDPSGDVVSSTSEILDINDTTTLVGSFHAPYLLQVND